MPTRFMTDPHEMRSMAGRFDVHAQTVEDEARKMWASSQNIAGASWSGTAQATSYDTMGQMNQAFRNIVNMLHGVRDGLIRDANNYEIPRAGLSADSEQLTHCQRKLSQIRRTDKCRLATSSAMSTPTAR